VATRAVSVPPFHAADRASLATFPLSIAQADIWFGQKLDPDSTRYSLGRYIEIFGSIDPTLFVAAIRQAVDDIDGLRLGFVETELGPRQFFRRDDGVEVPYFDVSGQANAGTEATTWMRADMARAFDLTSDPLFRYALFKVADDRYFWYELNHHLINDAFGSLLVERRVSEAYSLLLNGLERTLEMAPSLLDLLDEHEDYRLSAQYDRDGVFWRAKLADRPDPLSLSGRMSHWSGELLRSAGALPRTTAAALEEAGQAHGASLAAVITAATAVYMSRMTGARDVVVGMPVTGRLSPRLRRIVGLASNIVPLRLTIDPALTFSDLLQQTGRRMREALRHQRYPARALRQDLGLAPNEPDIYGTVINFIPLEEDFDIACLPVRKHHLGNWLVGDLLIAIHAGPQDSESQVEFIANRAHYDAPVLDGHRERLLRLLEIVAAQPIAAIGHFAILSDLERQQVLHDWNATATPPAPATLPELFEAQVARTPDAVALVHGDAQLTYAELNRRANQVANVLIRRGVGPEQLVGLCVGRTPEMIVGLLAILKAGAAYLPLDLAYPAARLALMLDDAQPGLILTDAETAPRLPAGIPHLVIETDSDTADGDTNPTDAQRLSALVAGHPAYVIYTSGSTGRPKGVVVTHAGIAALAAAQVEQLSVTAASRVLQFASLNFDASLWEVAMALTSGAALVLAPPEALSGPPLRALLAAQRVTHATFPPAVLATLGEADIPLGCLVVAGDACPAPLVAQWSAERLMVNAYGPTESTVCATISAQLDDAAAPIGAPIPGTRVYVLDASLEPVPAGVGGELYISGAGLARGYLNRPALTAERFVADPHGAPGSRMYRTGDLARWRSDGALDFLGRADQQIKLRGFRVEPGEIEAVLAAQPGVAQVAVVARDDRPGGAYLVAYLATGTGGSPDLAQLHRVLAEQLPSHMVPSAFVVLEALPLTPNGKLDRRSLPAPEGGGANLVEPPRGPIETAIAAIWADLLDLEHVGRHDNFFELGGHSLTALQMVSQVRDAFGVELPLKTVFDARTLEDLAGRIGLALLEGRYAPRMPLIEATPQQGSAPLSFSQERMWLIQSLDPATTAYNMAIVLRIGGRLDIAALSGALGVLHERHAVLRSTIRLVDGLPQQEIGAAPDRSLKIIDLRNQDAGEAMSEAVRLAEADARTPFDLEQGPVMRSQLFRTGEQTSLLSLVLHHVAGDQWSMGVLGRELAALYNAALSGRQVKLPTLPVSYRDYALWQRSGLLEPEFERQLAYWRRKLANLPSAELLTDRPRPSLPSLRGGFCQSAIPPALIGTLEQLGRSAGSTLFMSMLTAFATLVHRTTGQEDIPIGVPVANRSQSATEGLVGTFVNTLVLRTDLSGNPSFGDALQRVRAIALEAFAHQDIPFDWLVQALGQRRDTSRAPLAQIMFNVTNAPMHGIAFDGLDWEPVLVDRGGAQFELSLAVDPIVTRQLSVEYNTDLFDRSTIERFIGQYFTILEAAAATPETRLSALPLLSAAERGLLQSWNATEAPYPRDRIFARVFEDQAERTPEAIAVSFDGATLSYAQLNARANAIAQRLLTLGVCPGVLVAVCVPRSPSLLAALLGIQKSGGAYVPLDPDYPTQRLEYMLADSGAKVLVTAGAAPAGLEIPHSVATLDALTEVGSAHNPPCVAVPQDTAYVIYTSGSTGKPKGVAVPHGALLNFLCSMQESPGLTAEDVLAAVTTASFDIAALELYLPLMVGARIELVSRATAADGSALAQLLVASGASVLQATPSSWRMLLEAGWSGRPGFRALSGGEPLPRDLADALLARVDTLWNLYGPTETTIWSTLDLVERDGAAVSIGRPIANTQVHILDQAGEPMPIGVAGEICIGGAGLATGYLGRPSLTAERFIPDSRSEQPGARLYRTGDLGYWGADGKLRHLGRLDHQVKIRGFRIELGEIETLLRGHEAVREAVVLSREAQPGDQRLIAYLVYREGEDHTPSDVRRYLRERLPDFMIPSIVMALQSLPLTPNGKVDRNALPEPFRTAPRAAARYIAPAPGVEQMIAEVWQSVLSVERVSAEDNFFELGGHSLLSLRVAQAVAQRTGYSMDPRTLFFHTLRQVAVLLPPPAAHADRPPSLARGL